jgi:hypothetical protein
VARVASSHNNTGRSPLGGTTQSTLFLTAPATGTFIFVVCQNVSGDCRDVDSSGGSNPMGVYTFTPTLVKAGIRS